ncbi:hypothetical protein D3C78_1448730 [compost metagenome]
MLVTMPTVNDTDRINAILNPQYLPERSACLKLMPDNDGCGCAVKGSAAATSTGMRNHINASGSVNSSGIAPRAMKPACQP